MLQSIRVPVLDRNLTATKLNNEKYIVKGLMSIEIDGEKIDLEAHTPELSEKEALDAIYDSEVTYMTIFSQEGAKDGDN